MRMWNVDPKTMCRMHLLGEHLEMHMFAGCIRTGRPLSGYIKAGLVEPAKVKLRHDALAEEMLRRGYAHCSPLTHTPNGLSGGCVDPENSRKILRDRCPRCRQLQDEKERNYANL